ncbi:MAG: FKBP-type peptidyl-prolyl cis-trans isomerase [Methanoregula sp.]|nr:FKBP-type peptidyl-prolyl cis-trans isomerase [Methanoregula sp.]
MTDQPKTEDIKKEDITEENKEDKPETSEEKVASTEDKTAVKTEAVQEPSGKGKQKTFLLPAIVAVVIIAAAIIGYILLTPDIATTGDTVSVYYTEMYENGTLIESNLNGTPVTFTLGNGTVIKGFEEAVTGMSKDQEKTVTIPYDKAYGAYDPGLIQTLNRTGPIANTTFVEGWTYTVHYKTTNTYSKIKILNVTPTTITWDANNPLAGQNLTFTLKIANITKAKL